MRYIITHGHIFKNAGTTFDYALKTAFGRDFCDHRDDKQMRQGGAEYLKQFILDNPNIKAISSHHLCNPLPESDKFKCIPVYFLRNPIDRVVSVYKFERKQARVTKGAEMAAKLTLEEYVRWRMTQEAPKVIFDYQTAYIGRKRHFKPTERVGLEALNRALQRLTTNEILAGTVEQFDESFNLINKELQRYFPNLNLVYEKRNVACQLDIRKKYQSALAELTNVLPEIISGNTFDLLLHKVVRDQIQQPEAEKNKTERLK